MFCSKCGANNADGAKFCIGCGASLSEPVQPTASVPSVTPVPPQNPKKKKTGLIIGIVAGAVALIAVISVIVLFASKDKNGEKNNESSKPMVEDTVNSNEENNSSDVPQTDLVDTKHDSKVVGKWKCVMSEDIGDGAVLEMIAYFDFTADGRCKIYFDSDEVEKSITESLYSAFNKEIGGSYTKAQIDELLAKSGQDSIKKMVDGFMKEFRKDMDTDGYWETENGMMYTWDKTQKKGDEEPDKYTVSEDGKTITVVEDENTTYTLEKA